jgi:hypothetical protein
MDLPTDVHKLERVIALLHEARLISAVLGKRVDDLESLLSVSEIEAKRVYASTLAAEGKSDSIPVILSSDDASEKPKGSR